MFASPILLPCTLIISKWFALIPSTRFSVTLTEIWIPFDENLSEISGRLPLYSSLDSFGLQSGFLWTQIWIHLTQIRIPFDSNLYSFGLKSGFILVLNLGSLLLKSVFPWLKSRMDTFWNDHWDSKSLLLGMIKILSKWRTRHKWKRIPTVLLVTVSWLWIYRKSNV